MVDLSLPCTQEAFGLLVGISQQKVSQLLKEGVIDQGGSAAAWLTAYCERLRQQAAGRLGDATGGLDLVQERAALARSQREAQDMKNAVARGEFAPVGLLADVLAAASAGVVDRFEQLDGALSKACPDLPEAARLVVQKVIASARNEWVKSTESLVADALDALARDEDEDEDEDGALGVDGSDDDGPAEA